jgi:phosphatidylserine/phosphatidylglycerophosphate/cardiolipin synthase-like enzyme/regulation of enolase protein 1 (concanavalin A-like superfamily)
MRPLKLPSVALAALVILLLLPARARALERLCDPAFESCRSQLVTLIRAEKIAMDVAFWFMEDTNLAQEVVNRWKAGVPVRVLMDTEANADYPLNKTSLKMLRDAGIPMRNKSGGSGILHWKIFYFAGQNTVEFSGANYSAEAFGPGRPYADYVDEVIYFTDRPTIVNSFKTRYDDAWTDTTMFSNYANVTGALTRHYPTFPIDPEMNFVPWENFSKRSVERYKAETVGIDASMYRITDRAHTDALIAAIARGVPVRLITEQDQYRDPTRLWDSWNVDRLYIAGAKVKFRGHAGLSHEKLTILHGQAMAIFGSSNWTSASAAAQHEHNIFTTDASFVAWSQAHFDRKWNNLASSPETKAFAPLPPDPAVPKSPANGATGEPLSVTLKWYAGPWAHRYDVYLGTNASSLTRVLSDRNLGPSESATAYKSWAVSGLVAGRTYYWKVVSRTMANLTATSPIFSFTTAGGTATPGPLPSGWSHRDIGAVAAAGTASYGSGTFTVKASGVDIWGTADEFHFAYRPMTGNGTIVARVSTVQNVSVWTKAGVMMRESLAAGSKQAAMFVSAAKGLAFQRRVATGGISTHTAGANRTAPYWVKLTRSGNIFSAYTSPDGTSWTLVGSDTIAMASTIYVGLATTSHVDGTVATTTFTNVSTP